MRTAVTVLLALLVLGGVGLAFRSALAPSRDRGPHGQDLDIPGDYTTLALGEADLAFAAGELSRLLAAREPGARVAASYENPEGVAMQILVDPTRDLIDVRRIAPSGTLVRELWHGSVGARLERAMATGDFEVPGFPPPERRNLYH